MRGGKRAVSGGRLRGVHRLADETGQSSGEALEAAKARHREAENFFSAIRTA